MTPKVTGKYSVPDEAKKVFLDGILTNPLMQQYIPSGIAGTDDIEFSGSADPSIPVNWRFAESVSALKAYEAVVLKALIKRKYNTAVSKVQINTDHAQLFIMSSLLWALDPEGQNLTAGSMLSPEGRKRLESYFPECDKYQSNSTYHRMAATNIYKCHDGRYFHTHTSMNAEPTLRSLGLPLDLPAKSHEEALLPFIKTISQIESEKLQILETDKYRQAGTICYSTDDYKTSDHGKANAHVGLFEIHEHPNSVQQPSWWPTSEATSVSRPLAGLKVVDLTRIIAGPAVSRGLAELGASVMRITAAHLPDLSALHMDMNWGKWNATLDLREAGDREKLRELVADADVFLQGYRPDVFDKFGFGEKDILEMVKDRERGIVYAHENCYGWNGPWSQRSGWQQISDANVGVSLEFGRAMGLDEPVTPVFPNSDYCTGIAGTIGIMTALLWRAERGGSYTVDIALNYYSQWLVSSVGTYPTKVWENLWTRNGRQILRHTDNMPRSIPIVLRMLMTSARERILRSEFFHQYPDTIIGIPIKTVAPILRFENADVKPGYHVSTRGNGVDQPKWPRDLLTTQITS